MSGSLGKAWPTLTIAEVTKTSAGGTPRKSGREFYEGGKIPWLLSGEVASRDIASAKNYITPAGLEGSSAKLFPRGSVLVAMYGATAGEVGILRIEAATNQAVCAILPGEKHIPEYVYYYFLHAKKELVALAVGNAQPNISQAKIKSTCLPVPPLDEQKRIVAVLDQAFAALDRAHAHAEANLAGAQRLFGLEVDRMRGNPAPSWPVLKLEKLAAVISGQHILAGEYNSERRGIGYLTGPSDFGNASPIVSKWTEYPKRTAIRGDILITVKGSGVGSLNIMVEDELAISRQLMAIRTKPDLREFIYLNLEASYQHFQGLANGAAIPGISRSDVLDFELAMPKSSELPSLLNRLRNLRANSDRLAQRYSDRLYDIANLRQSLLQKAFSGQLT